MGSHLLEQVILVAGLRDEIVGARLNAGFPTAAACVFELKAKRFVLFTPKALGA